MYKLEEFELGTSDFATFLNKYRVSVCQCKQTRKSLVVYCSSYLKKYYGENTYVPFYYKNKQIRIEMR